MSKDEALLPERIWLSRHYPCLYRLEQSSTEDVEYVPRASSPAQAEWLDIESAPKDGTPVLLVWHWDSGIHQGVTVISERWYCRTHAHLSRSKNCPDEPDCKMNWGAYGGYMSHWMPLPAPPKETSK